MEESWEDLLCRVYYAGYEDCQRARDYDPMGNKVVDTARIKAEKMEQRIRKLEAHFDALRSAVKALPVEKWVKTGSDGSPELIGYIMRAQGDWDAVIKALDPPR